MKKITLLFILIPFLIFLITFGLYRNSLRPHPIATPIRPIIRPAQIGWLDITENISKFEKIVTHLATFEDDPSIDGIILRIDSSGGSFGDSLIIADYIYQLKNKKPVIAFISNVCASGAYLIATACSHIICPAGSSIGSIGAVVSQVFEKDKTYINIVSGKFKRIGLDQNYKISRAHLKEQQVYVNALAEIFIDKISSFRNIPKERLIELQAKLLCGSQALEYTLVDQNGTLHDAIEKAVQLVCQKNNKNYDYLKLVTHENKLIKLYDIKKMRALPTWPLYKIKN